MQIKKFQPVDHYVRATVYGGSGVGKTVFGGTAPKPIFASAENGLLSIVSTLGYSPDYVSINSISDMQELYKFLKDGNHSYETLVIDSMTEMNEMIKDGIEKRIGKAMEIQDWGELARKLKGIIRAIQDLPIHIILICQEKIETDKKGNVLNVKPMLNGKTSDEVAYLMDIVAYMYINSKGERVITTSPNEKLVSKDRTGLLQTDVSLNFNDRVVAMQGMKAGSEEVVREIPKSATPVESQEPTPPVEKPQETIATKPIAHADKMIAMTAFGKYAEQSNPTVDKKEYFTIFVKDRFGGKEIDQLTEAEGKELIAQIQEIVTAFEETKKKEAEELENQKQAEETQKSNEAAEKMSEIENGTTKVESTESDRIDAIVDGLPF